jgi:hypothetical protein
MISQNKEYVDIFANGIIDPVKIVRTASLDAGARMGGMLM